MKRRSLWQSLCCALRGLWICLLRERNLRIHICGLCYVIWLGRVLEVDVTRWAVLMLTCSTVFVAELLNSAVETLVDSVTHRYAAFARMAKDIAAGAVLVSAIFALVVGWLVFEPLKAAPVLMAWLSQSLVRLVLLVGSVCFSLAFIFLFGRKKQGVNYE